MSELSTAVERITTEADGPETVNESLSTGGPGPQGQLDAVVERLSGSKDSQPPVDEDAAPESEPAKPAAKKKS